MTVVSCDYSSEEMGFAEAVATLDTKYARADPKELYVMYSDLYARGDKLKVGGQFKEVNGDLVLARTALRISLLAEVIGSSEEVVRWRLEAIHRFIGAGLWTEGTTNEFYDALIQKRNELIELERPKWMPTSEQRDPGMIRQGR